MTGLVEGGGGGGGRGEAATERSRYQVKPEVNAVV